jgi:adenosylcobinamide-GDP ribazoletransferase
MMPEAFRVAVSFLTILPASRGLVPDPRTISNSRAFYPVVGLLLGLPIVAVGLVPIVDWPFFPRAAFAFLLLLVMTRALHLDGLMDVCDGIFGGHTKERRLEIMKDPHVGAFGVAGAIAVSFWKLSALSGVVGVASLPDLAAGATWTVLLFPAISRWAMVVALFAFPYAREDGLGSPFHQGGTLAPTLAAGAIVLVASVLLGGFGGLGILAGASVLALLLGLAMSRALGGLTGDCYGAINEVTEAAVLTAMTALIWRRWLEPLPNLLDRF